MNFKSINNYKLILITVYIFTSYQPIFANSCKGLFSINLNLYSQLSRGKEWLSVKTSKTISSLMKSDISSAEMIRDLNSNIILISSNTMVLIFTPHGKIYLGNLKMPLESGRIGSAHFWFRGAKESWNVGSALLNSKQLLDKIFSANQSEIEFDMKYNLKEIDMASFSNGIATKLNADFDSSLPQIILDSKTLSHPTDWTSYSGKEVIVIFSRANGENVATQQRVSSVEEIQRKDPEVFESLSKLLVSESEALKSEVGIWLLRIDGKITPSETFSSGQFNQLNLNHGLEKLIQLMRDSSHLDGEITEIILAHSHPIKGAPLSPADISVLNELFNTLPPSAGLKLTIIAYSGEFVFSSSKINEN